MKAAEVASFEIWGVLEGLTRHQKDTRAQKQHEIAVIDGEVWQVTETPFFACSERLHNADVGFYIRASACSIPATSKGSHPTS
jgi:hypothetical protein